MSEWTAQKPLSGVIICCTNIVTEERHNLAAVATEMGASHRYDLTADVSHLVVGSIDSEKYKYVARERPDVKAVKPTWIEAVRSIWMDGIECTEADILALENEHRVPPIWNLQVCLTGFDEVEKREEIKSNIERGGANYHPDLTKSVSHLVTKTTQGKKYDAARRWGITCVSEKWLSDCLERGMALEEESYNPLLPLAEQGVGAWRRDLAGVPNEFRKKRKLESRSGSGSDGKRKLRRTMSAKLKSNSDSLWADIGTGSTPKGPADGFAEAVDDSTILPVSVAEKDQTPDPPSATVSKPEIPAEPAPRKEGIFAGVAVFVQGFPSVKLQILTNHLGANGAVLPSAWSEDSIIDGFEVDDKILMIPHDLHRDEYPPMPPQLLNLPIVTEFWVESCLHMKAAVDPMQDRFTQPFKSQRIEGLKGLVVACTGFKDMDLLHLSKAIQMTGAAFDEFVRPEVGLLIAQPTATYSDKLKCAWELKTPVVTLDWFWECLETGTAQPYDKFLVKPPAEFVAQRNRLLRGSGSKISRTSVVERIAKAGHEERQRPSSKNANARAELMKASSKSSSRPLKEVAHEKLNKPSSSPPKPMAVPRGKGRMPFVQDDDDEETASENTDPSQQRQGQPPLNDAQAAELLNLLDGPKGARPRTNNRPQVARMQPPSMSREKSTSVIKPAELKSSIETLLAAKQATARRPSTSEPEVTTASDRRKRGLGRAASGNSVTSSAMSNHIGGSTTGDYPGNANDESQSFSQRFYAEHGGNDSFEVSEAPKGNVPPATQGLVYGDDEMRERKEAVLRMLTGETTDEPSPKKRKPEAMLKDVLPSNNAGIGARIGRKGKVRRT